MQNSQGLSGTGCLVLAQNKAISYNLRPDLRTPPKKGCIVTIVS